MGPSRPKARRAGMKFFDAWIMKTVLWIVLGPKMYGPDYFMATSGLASIWHGTAHSGYK